MPVWTAAPAALQELGQRVGGVGADRGTCLLQRAEGAGGDELATVEDHDLVGEVFDLVQQVARDEDRASRGGALAKQVAQPADALGVEAVAGLVEHQDRWIAEQRGRQPEALPHAQGVPTHVPVRGVAQTDGIQHLGDAPGVDVCSVGEDPQVVAAAASGVERVRLEDHADRSCGVVHLPVSRPSDRGVTVVGLGEVQQDLHRRGLPGTVGSQEAGDPSRLHREGEVVDDNLVPVAFRDVLELKRVHGHCLSRWT